MVCLIMRTEVVGFSTSVGSSWIFLIVPESMYKGGVESALGVSNMHLWTPTKRSLDLSWLRSRLNLCRNASIVCGASTTYLDLTSTPGSRYNPVVSVCHRHTPAKGILVNCPT